VQPLVASGELFNTIRLSLEEGSLAGCSFSADGAGEVEADRGEGIYAVSSPCRALCCGSELLTDLHRSMCDVLAAVAV
jgi:hypothetical protein